MSFRRESGPRSHKVASGGQAELAVTVRLLSAVSDRRFVKVRTLQGIDGLPSQSSPSLGKAASQRGSR